MEVREQSGAEAATRALCISLENDTKRLFWAFITTNLAKISNWRLSADDVTAGTGTGDVDAELEASVPGRGGRQMRRQGSVEGHGAQGRVEGI